MKIGDVLVFGSGWTQGVVLAEDRLTGRFVVLTNSGAVELLTRAELRMRHARPGTMDVADALGNLARRLCVRAEVGNSPHSIGSPGGIG